MCHTWEDNHYITQFATYNDLLLCNNKSIIPNLIRASIPVHPHVLSGVRGAHSLVFCVLFCRPMATCAVSFDH